MSTPEPEAWTRQQTQATPEPDQPTSDEPVAAVGELDATALRRIWPDVLEVVKRSSRRTRALLDNAQITAAQGVSRSRWPRRLLSRR